MGIAQEETDGFAPLVAHSDTLADTQWVNRAVIVFADSENDPRFKRQLEMLAEGWGDLAPRDVIVITDTDRQSQTDVRQKLRPRGFMLVLLAKDGTIAQRKPAPWTAREIARAIDKMPLRQQEIDERRAIAPLTGR